MAFFSAWALLFGLVFSAVPESSSAALPYQNSNIISAAGRPGVTSPVGLVAVSSESQPAATAPGTTILQDDGTPVVIPPKPTWTKMPLYVDPTNEATEYAAANPGADGASYIARMGQAPVAQWFGDWNSNVTAAANTYVSAAAAVNAVPVLVLYNIPQRDCGGYSIGGAAGVSAYTQWVQQVATGIGNRTAVVILEPDALGAVDCLASGDQQARYQSISQAVSILKTRTGASVYIDAGTPVWQSTTTMAARLKAANVAMADGFSINVSYFASTGLNQSYGDQLSKLVGYKHYVIDTSRNGGNHTVSGAICNPSYASFGNWPTANTGNALNDALLWIKIPWESDGPCNGSPNPGVPYWSYAVQLAKNAGW